MKKVKQVNSSKAQESLSYNGLVEISLKHKSKTIKYKKYKNNGGYPLFQFIALSLCGLYSDAETLRPKYVQLFWIQTNETSGVPTNEEIKRALDNGTEGVDLKVLSSRAVYKSTPAPLKNSDPSNPAYSTTLEFLIPFAQIQSNERANALALYYSGSSSTREYCAFTGFNSSILEEATDDYNLFVQWTLSITNK